MIQTFIFVLRTKRTTSSLLKEAYLDKSFDILTQNYSDSVVYFMILGFFSIAKKNVLSLFKMSAVCLIWQKTMIIFCAKWINFCAKLELTAFRSEGKSCHHFEWSILLKISHINIFFMKLIVEISHHIYQCAIM